MGKSRKLRQNKKNGKKSRKMMMTPFKNNFTRKIFGGANKRWVVTLVKDEAPGSTPVVKKISVGDDKNNMKYLSYNTVTGKWVMPELAQDFIPDPIQNTIPDPTLDIIPDPITKTNSTTNTDLTANTVPPPPPRPDHLSRSPPSLLPFTENLNTNLQRAQMKKGGEPNQ